MCGWRYTPLDCQIHFGSTQHVTGAIVSTSHQERESDNNHHTSINGHTICRPVHTIWGTNTLESWTAESKHMVQTTTPKCTRHIFRSQTPPRWRMARGIHCTISARLQQHCLENSLQSHKSRDNSRDRTAYKGHSLDLPFQTDSGNVRVSVTE